MGVETTTSKKATLQDLALVPGKAELIGGKIIHFMPTGYLPSRIGLLIVLSLERHSRATGHGVAFTDNMGFAVPELPSGRESFSPDASYYDGPLPSDQMDFAPGPPTFAVEVRSKTDYGKAAEGELAAKRSDYFQAGTKVVWDVDPRDCSVHVYRGGAIDRADTFTKGQQADAEPAVPGWRMAVDEIFPDLEETVADIHGRAEPAVAWREVRKAYPDGHEALAGVTLEVAPGSCLAILGTSGSGKTTLLKMVNRLIEPTSGTVLVRGRATTEWDPIALRRSIGYVIQDVGLMPHMSVLENVGLVLRVQGTAKEQREEQARAHLELVGMDPGRFGRLWPHQLSGGQKQRVGVARALAADPDLILMDEPFGALDPITRRELQDEFRSLQRRLGTTVVFVTHDIREACRVGDRLALMDRGRLVQYGAAAELLEHPADSFVRSFFREAEAVLAEPPREGS